MRDLLRCIYWVTIGPLVLVLSGIGDELLVLGGLKRRVATGRPAWTDEWRRL